MFTECPTCNTVFRVHPEQLEAARGKVRCGECLAVFDAREYLREDLEEPAEEAAAKEPVAAPETQGALPLAEAPDPEAPREPPRRPTRVSPPERARFHAPALPESSRPSHGALWLTACLLLLLALAGQYLWFNRAALATIPALRTALTLLCGADACAPAGAADRFTLTGRAVQSHPDYADALLVDATFVNQSDAPQPYPGLELVFTDPEGVPLASRRFLPEQYLGHAPQQPLAPGAEAHVVLELLDPGDLAVGYEFRFF